VRERFPYFLNLFKAVSGVFFYYQQGSWVALGFLSQDNGKNAKEGIELKASSGR